MLLPIRTNIRCYRTPYANYAIIAVNVIVFLLSYWPDERARDILRPWAEQFVFTPAHPFLWQFITYAFLHSGFLHIFGNMFFLYMFGNNVNDKLGHFGYTCFYLAGAVFSAVGHTLINSNPVMGASGAVAAVTGAYLVLFPQTLITIVYWFIFIGTIDVPALYFIAFKMIILDNVIIRYTANTNVAYDAHLAGYTFGIASSVFLLATGLLSSSQFDLWAMLKQWNRRRVYRDAISTGYNPYTGMGGKKSITAREVTKPGPDEPQIRQLREDIANSVYRHDLQTAAQQYLNLVSLDSGQILPRQYLLDIANQFASEGRYSNAASVYEKFITHYANYEHIEQVELMLGIIYSRYLEKPDLALNHLRIAEKKIADPAQLLMCRSEIEKLQNR
ncbi:MAG: rhomboid family intramembrane serine protease [Sedimentisphaerales bacterium]|jgi:membrane associated rhomboid family serine protease